MAHMDDLRAVLKSRLGRNRPTIFEGVVALRLLRSFDIDPECHIHITCEDVGLPDSIDWKTYVAEFSPETNSDLLLDLPAIF